MTELIAALGGAIIAGILSPIAMDHYTRWRREKDWARPRKKRLKTMLEDRDVAPAGFRSLDRLCLETGMKPEDCRTLLIELGARGGTMTVDGTQVEGWTLEKLDD